MNVADSRRLASALERLGYVPADRAEDADVIVLNTCVVRRSAEDRVYGRLGSLKPLKKRRPQVTIGLMGCLVGVRDPTPLRRRFPWVDVFMPPSEPGPLLDYLAEQGLVDEGRALETAEAARRYRLQDSALLLPAHERGRLVSAYITIVLGCSHACSYCIIPYRRGPERSRPVEEILTEARALAAQGVKEITLLGQIVDRYGLEGKQEAGGKKQGMGSRLPLVDLLHQIHEIEGLERIRFLTSHPSWMTPEIIATVARHPRICPQFEIAVQSGNDEILQRMRRGHTVDDFRRIVESIRRVIPEAAIHTDVIVGFPGETEAQFDDTCRLLQELELDKVHVAAYSERPGTFAARHYTDDVPPDQKKRRLKTVEDLQRGIQLRKNRALVGRTVEILVEEKRRDRWYGRTRCNRIVFASNGGTGDLRGKLIPVRITGAGPYSLTGEIASGGPC